MGTHREDEGDTYRRVDDSMTLAVEEPILTGTAAAKFDSGWKVASSPADLVHAYRMLENDASGLTIIASAGPRRPRSR